MPPPALAAAAWRPHAMPAAAPGRDPAVIAGLLGMAVVTLLAPCLAFRSVIASIPPTEMPKPMMRVTVDRDADPIVRRIICEDAASDRAAVMARSVECADPALAPRR